MNHRFRQKLRAWLPGVIFWMVLGVGCMGLGAVLVEARLWMLSLLCLGLAGWGALMAWLSWVELDGDGIGGRWKGRRFFLPWRVVRAIWVEGEDSPLPVLQLGTESGVLSMPLRGLDVHELLRYVRLRLPPAMQTAAAHEQYMEMRHQDYVQGIHLLPLPLQVGYGRGLVLLFWFGVAFWACMVVISWVSQDANRLMGVMCFSLFLLATLGMLALLMQKVRLDAEGISELSLMGHYRIRWEEIERVWMGTRGQSMLIEGQGKRLALQGPAAWAGKPGEMARYYFTVKLEMLGIVPQVDSWLEARLVFSNRSARVQRSENLVE